MTDPDLSLLYVNNPSEAAQQRWDDFRRMLTPRGAANEDDATRLYGRGATQAAPAPREGGSDDADALKLYRT